MEQIKEAIDIIRIVAVYGDDIGRHEAKQLREAVKLLEKYLYSKKREE